MAFRVSTPTGPRIWRPMRLGGILTFLIACALLCWPGNSKSASAGTQSVSNVQQAFSMAALHWQVPENVLMAIGYVESHWWQRGGEPSLDQGFGVMHLVAGTGGTLERAAQLTGLSQDSLRTDAAANIEGGAAMLSYISREPGQTSPKLDDPASWYQSVEKYSGAQDQSVRESYAQDVFQVVTEGANVTLPDGAQVSLTPTAVQGLPKPDAAAPASDDYPPALWVPANANNYTVGRPYGPLTFIVIHDTEGSYASAINWFQNPSSGVSAHYVIRSSDGQITQMVRNADTAYHAGVWDYNVRAIGIEHEGYMSQPGWYTEAMYQSSSVLARTLADRYGVHKDRAHIIGHYQIPNQSHTDPGPYWDWTHYMSLVRRDWAASAIVDNTDSGFQAVPPQIDTQHAWHVYGGGYSSSSTYSTYSTTDPASSTNSGTWTTSLPSSGLYDVYAFVPYVDNSNPDTSSAHYQVLTNSGWQTANVSQSGITDVGSGSWAHLGAFSFNAGATTQVKLTDLTGDTGKNVWFDAVMWIPRVGGSPQPTSTPPPNPTRTRVPTATRTPVHAPTSTPTRTPTPAATWTPGPCGMRFSDLPDDYWAYQYISYLYCNGIISGYADGTFRPGATTTRGQIAKMLALGFGWVGYYPAVPDFSDVGPDNPFYPYIETGYIRGVFSGYDDGTFRPNNPVTRAQDTKMLVLAKGWTATGPPQPDFTDVPLESWAYTFVETAYSHGIVSGYDDGTFRPGASVNRGQFSKMLALSIQSALSPRNAPPAVPKK